MKPYLTKLSYLILIFYSMQFAACTKDPFALPAEVRSYTNVDNRMWVVFNRFEEAAAARGVFIDLEEMGISGKIADLVQEHAAGLCSYNVNRPNDIVIDAGWWKRVGESKRELIIFHELGHCILGRGHEDSVNVAGGCLSIMRSGTGTCLDLYGKDNRSEYLDELFKSE